MLPFKKRSLVQPFVDPNTQNLFEHVCTTENTPNKISFHPWKLLFQRFYVAAAVFGQIGAVVLYVHSLMFYKDLCAAINPYSKSKISRIKEQF